MSCLFRKAKSFFKLLLLFFSSLYNTKKRSLWDYFEYEKLSTPFDIFCYKTYMPNKFYGIDVAVRNKINKKLPSNLIIEHGVYFSNILNPGELKFFANPVIYTMGKQREVFLKKNGFANVFSIGPYINYVENFKAKNDLKKLKCEMGRVLLVFPSHSIEGVDSVFDEQQFLKEINIRSSCFERTLICMYWKDILDNRHLIYKSSGYTIVTAGYRNDPYFLSRLKDLIELSDMTMSNALGTHIGYSVALGKPHYLFKQKNSYCGKNLYIENKNKDLKVLEDRKQVFYDLFGVYEERITKEQIDVVKYYWGDF